MFEWIKRKFMYGSLIPVVFFLFIFIGCVLVFVLIQDNRKALTVEIGNTIVVKGSIETNEEGIEWTSSNVDVATVTKDGTIYGVSPGESEIALKVDDDIVERYRVIVYSFSDEDNTTKKYINVDKIILDTKSKNMYTGDTLKLNATISPSDATDKNIKWESSDQNIATVNQNGEVTAISEGKVDIYAKGAQKKSAKATINIYKKDEDPTPITPQPGGKVTAIAIKQGKEKILKAGATKQLSLVTPVDGVTWKSSNPNIASVDGNGKVTAKKKGYAIIVATTSNNLSAPFMIIVRNNVTPELDMEIDNTSTYIGGTLKITAENNTGSPISYESSNSKVASVDSNGKITARRSGSTKITIKSDNIERKVEINVTGSRVHFINLGVAGDAILLESNGSFAMVDVGGKEQSGTIKNYLDSYGINKLDFVILTHPHSDHIGGFINLLNSGLKVNTIYTKKYNFNDIAALNGSTSTRTRYNNTISMANKYNVKVVYVDETIKDGDSISLNGMKVYFLNTIQRLVTKNKTTFNYATSNYWAGKSENVNSIANLVRVNNRNVLLTSDLNDYNILSAVVNKANGIISGQRLDVYKVAHHGYHNCTGNKNLTVRADRYIVTNNINDRAGDGSYQITNNTTANGTSCFARMNINMCNAYYANNSTGAVVANLTTSGVNITGGGYGKNATNRCN